MRSLYFLALFVTGTLPSSSAVLRSASSSISMAEFEKRIQGFLADDKQGYDYVLDWASPQEGSDKAAREGTLVAPSTHAVRGYDSRPQYQRGYDQSRYVAYGQQRASENPVAMRIRKLVQVHPEYAPAGTTKFSLVKWRAAFKALLDQSIEGPGNAQGEWVLLAKMGLISTTSLSNDHFFDHVLPSDVLSVGGDVLSVEGLLQPLPANWGVVEPDGEVAVAFKLQQHYRLYKLVENPFVVGVAKLFREIQKFLMKSARDWEGELDWTKPQAETARKEVGALVRTLAWVKDEMDSGSLLGRSLSPNRGGIFRESESVGTGRVLVTFSNTQHHTHGQFSSVFRTVQYASVTVCECAHVVCEQSMCDNT